MLSQQSGLYDINKEIPIFYSLNRTNERKALLNDIENIHINDDNVIIGDRGYFSFETINKLLKRKIHFIFRIKSNLKMVKNNINILKNKKTMHCRI